jgi:subtilase family serine protease
VYSTCKPAVFLLTLGLTLSALSQTKAVNRITQAIDDRETTQLRGNVHPLLQRAADQGRMDGGTRLEGVSLVFKRTAAQDAAVEKLLTEQQDPASPNYHRWLTPEQYADRFGLSAADVNKVVAWLTSQGFTVNRVARGRTQVWFTGTVTQIETVFRTEMHHYLVNGEMHFANGTEPAVPAALAGIVLGVHNLNDFRPKARAHVKKLSPQEVNAHFTSGVSGNHYLAPDDIATIYGLQTLYSKGFDGNGQSLVVVGQSAINTSDLDAFRSAANLPARTSSNFELVLVPNTGSSTVKTGDVDESSLDLEWAAGVGKGATEIFVYVGNSSNFSVFDSLVYAIDNKLAPIISMSYGNCEQAFSSSNIQTFQQLTQQATTQGQTISAASGDFGAADCETTDAIPVTHGLAIDLPGALPLVTSVGGTEFSADVANPATYWSATNNANSGSALSYIPETGWNDTTLVGKLRASGGGVSTLFAKPLWQTGTGVPNDGKRDVPDFSLAASPEHDGYLLCSQGSCVSGFRDGAGGLNVAGGTSFGAPIFAGVLAIWNEAVASTGQGNVNPSLYQHAADFHDVTTGDNKVPCASGSPNCPTSGSLVIGYAAGTGYDLVTGLGSPKVDVLISSSTGYVTAPDYVLSQNAALTIASPGQSTSSVITVSAINGFTGQVTLTCTPPAASSEVGCTITPSVTVGATSGAATLSITTTKAHVVQGPAAARNRSILWFTGFGSLAGVFLFTIPQTRRRYKVAFALVVLAVIGAAVGCGGSGSSTPKNPGTPAGTYMIGVSATGATSHNTTVTVVVQ